MNSNIVTANQLNKLILENKAIMIYFYNDHCAPCQSLRPKITTLIQDEFPLIKMVMINAESNMEITAFFEVFASPTLLIFFEGKETIRKSQYVSIAELRVTINRYYRLLFK